MRLEMQGSCNDSDNNNCTHFFGVSVLYVGLNTLRIKVLASLLPEFESCCVTYLFIILGKLFSLSVPQLTYL